LYPLVFLGYEAYHVLYFNGEFYLTLVDGKRVENYFIYLGWDSIGE